MKNQDNWKPSRVKEHKGAFVPDYEYYGLCSRYLGQLVVSKYAQTIRENAKGDFLDCGCGQAPYYIIYKDLINKVICVDWEVTESEHDYLDFTTDLNQPLDCLQDNEFDTILLADVLEHIYKPKELIAEMHRVLKPGGKLMVFVPFFYWVHSEPHDYFRYTEYALKKMVEENKLKVIQLEPYGGYLDILFDLINKFFVNSKFCAKQLIRFARWLKKTRYYKKREGFRLKNFPLGYILIAEKTT